MLLKQRIGNRIAESRKDRGLTVKELSEHTGMTSTRISNWEQGTRSPGPEEAMQLAQALELSASYLLCLTDNQSGELVTNNNLYAPLIPIDSLPSTPKALTSLLKKLREDSNAPQVSLNGLLTPTPNQQLFAVQLTDNSMEPSFNSGDVVIINAKLQPHPGKFVIAQVNISSQPVFRKYRETNKGKSITVELNALNTDWPEISICTKSDASYLGVAVGHFQPL
ncbi:MAG: LexA family transcriptional regulator [Coxiellaceae bacterium]|nr:LexA family transcriptional regulator [Coxiellaceae bacterium]